MYNNDNTKIVAYYKHTLTKRVHCRKSLLENMYSGWIHQESNDLLPKYFCMVLT
jgi:hypothetical protein